MGRVCTGVRSAKRGLRILMTCNSISLRLGNWGPLRGLCFDASVDRRVIDRNHKLEAYRKKASELLTSEEGLWHRGRRCIEPEVVFGQMKYNMAYNRFRYTTIDKVTMDFAFFAIAFNIKKMVAKMTRGGLFYSLRPYMARITPFSSLARLLKIYFAEKQKLVAHPYKEVQRFFVMYIWSFNTPSSFDSYIKPQPITENATHAFVVYLLIPTSNHNIPQPTEKDVIVVYLLIPTSNHNLHRIPCLVFLLYIF